MPIGVYIRTEKIKQAISKAMKGKYCGKNSYMFGKKHSEETKRKMSEAKKDKVFSDEYKLKLSLAKIGKKNSKEHCKNISKARKGIIFSDEHCKNISKAKKGKKFSEETKLKMSKAQTGRKHTDKTKLRISKINKGKKRTSEQCKNMSKIQIGKLHWNWKGGICKEPYCQEFTQDLKDFIKQRDNYKCMAPLCDKKITKNNPLGVHHIDYDKKNCVPENLISNCRSCNFIANFNRDDWKEIYRTVIKQNYRY